MASWAATLRHLRICFIWLFCYTFYLLFPWFSFLVLSLPAFFLFVLTYLLFFTFLDTFLCIHPNSIKFRCSQALLLLPLLPLNRYSLERYFFVSSRGIIWIQWSRRQLVCSVYKNYSKWTLKRKEISRVEILSCFIDRACRKAPSLVVRFHLFIPFTFDMGARGMIWVI